MAVFNPHQVQEINEVIAEIAKAIKAKSEIGAHDKASLTALLKTQKPKKEATFFKCSREYSDTIVNHFVKEKEVTRSRFHKIHQTHIFIVK